MTSELRAMIEQLEAERDELVNFVEEIHTEMRAGKLTDALAEEIYKRAYGDVDYFELLRLKNEHIAEARAILRSGRKETEIKVAPILLVLLIATAFAFNFSGITGFVTNPNEQFFRSDIGVALTQNSVIPLSIDKAVSSVRLDGSAAGIGTANVWLLSGTQRYLVATFDSSTPASASLITGLVTSGGEIIGLANTSANNTNATNETNDTIVSIPEINSTNETNDTVVSPIEVLELNQTNETNATNETNNLTEVTEPTPIETPVIESTANETNQTNETNSTQPVVVNNPEVNSTNETNATNETNSITEINGTGTNETNSTNETVVVPPIQVPETNSTNLTNSTNETNQTPPIQTGPIVLTPSQPQETGQSSNKNNFKQQNFNKECLESCILPLVSPPLLLQVELTGNVTLTIDNVIYGEPRDGKNIDVPHINITNTTNETIAVNETIIVNETNSTNESIPANETVPENVTLPENITLPVNETNETNETNQTAPVNETINETISVNETNNTNISLPENITIQVNETNETNQTNQTTLLQTGAICSLDSDCASNICVSSIYQGQQTNGLCADTRLTCVMGTTLYNISQSVDDSTCFANPTQALWVAKGGTGRFALNDENGNVVAVIDRYGTMAIAGTLTQGEPPYTTGWTIASANGTPVLVIDETGSLTTQGVVSDLTTPSLSGGNDFAIRDTAGNVRALITSTGNVHLSGLFASGVNLQ